MDRVTSDLTFSLTRNRRPDLRPQARFFSDPPQETPQIPLPAPLPVPSTPKTYRIDMPTDRPWIVANREELGLYIPWIRRRDINESLREALKSGVPGRRWDPKEKRWFVPISQALVAARILDKFLPELAEAIRNSSEINRWEGEQNTKWELSGAKSFDEISGDWSEMQRLLREGVPDGVSFYDYQKVGVAYLLMNDGKAIIGDEQGLGKTVQALGFYMMIPEKMLVVCPKNPKFNWALEARRWIPGARIVVFVPTMTKKEQKFWERKGIYIWTKKEDPPADIDILIVNYSNLRAKEVRPKEWELNPIGQTILSLGFKTIVVDECQKWGNWRTQQTQGGVKVADSCDYVIGLSGTPIQNKLAQFFTILRLIKPTEFPSYMAFITEYCGGHYEEIETRRGIVKALKTGEVQNWKKLSRKLKSCMIRRLKKDVLAELPSKRRQILEVEIDMTKYRKAEKILKSSLKAGRLSSLEFFTEMRQEVGRLKVAAALETLEDLFESEEIPLVFYHFREVGSMLEAGVEKLGKIPGKIDGQTSASARARVIDEFQGGRKDCMVMSTLAASTGITLTRSATSMFVELEWSATDHLQAEDRNHRVGQENSVMIYYLRAPGTIDDYLMKHLDFKSDQLERVLNEKERAERMTSITQEYLGGK